jgi:uncharacterized protein (TIGR02271 family)
MANTVIGVFDTYSHAQSAMDELLKSGFDRDDVRLSPSEESSTARQTALRSDTSEDSGWSIGKFFRSLFGADDDATRESDVYSEAIRRGSYMLTVDADSDEERDRATDILNRYNPVDIDERASHWKSQGWSRYDSSAPLLSDDEITQDRSSYASGLQGGRSAVQDSTAAQPAAPMSTTGQAATGQTATERQAMAGTQNQRGGTLEGEARIPVVEEQLQVGKREVQRGGVRVFQRMTEKPVQEQVQLREEHVKVERHAVDQPATQADMAAFKEGSIEVRETAEEPVVGKTARIVEEVVVGKEVRERTETINDTLRRTDVEVEQLGAGSTAGRATMDDSAFRNHWQSNYASAGGTYDDYAPAYQYGSTLAGNDKYRGRRWEDIESDVRTDWEARHAGSPWERAKGAVRHAWEKMTGAASTAGTRTGTTMGTTADNMAATTGSAMGDDSTFRNHWQTSYANQGGRYEDYAPAYRYGSMLRGNEKYRGRQWEEIEPQARTDWESNNAGTPWEKTKDAVRYGWEKVTK